MYGYNGYGQPMQPNVTPSAGEKRSIRKLYNSVGIAMITEYFFGYALVYIAAFILGGRMNEQYNADGVRIIDFTQATVLFCAPAVASLIVFIGYNLIHKVKASNMFGKKNISGKYILGSVCAVFLFHRLGIILQYGVYIVLSTFNLDTPSLYYELVNDVPTTFVNVFSSIILAPVAEELFYRGLVLKQLSRVSRRFAIIASSLFFALAHGNPYQAVMTFLAGLVLGYITVETDSLIPAIICHIAINSVASAYDIVYYFDPVLADEVYYMLGVLEFVIGAVGLAVIMRGYTIKLPPYTEYHKKRTLPLISTSAAMIIIFVIYIIDMIASVQPIEETEEYIQTAVRIFMG